ncbi:MAG: hypothetical protein HC927_00405 [Deltaproteobacteria bacterium]|nr:hypothetical protein [Deltaproteobacteria bacterium]
MERRRRCRPRSCGASSQIGRPSTRASLAYPRSRIGQFSPRSRAILELGAERDLEVLHRLHEAGVLLGDQSAQGWRIEYSTDLHMTNDSKLFAPLARWEAQGYRADEYGHWLAGKWRASPGSKHVLERGLVRSRDGEYAIAIDDIEDVALALHQGVMINQFEAQVAAPKYLISARRWLDRYKPSAGLDLVFRDIARTTDTRTFIATPLEAGRAGTPWAC